MAVVVMAICLVASSAVQVQAASGTGLDGTNPASTGCANGSYPVFSRTLYNWQGTKVGTFEFRYSPTSVEPIGFASTIRGAQSALTRRSGPAQGFSEVIQVRPERDSGAGWSYGMQVYAPGSTHVNASVYMPAAGWNVGSSAKL